MIDWLTAKIPLTTDKVINGGKLTMFRRDGSIDWEAQARLSLEGSHSSNITIRSVEDRPNLVEISGNPAKFLQGHNVFGTDDVAFLVWRLMRKLCELLPTPIPIIEEDELRWLNGDFSISRIDINYMLEFRDRAECRAFVRALGENTHIKYRGKADMDEGTAYFGKVKKGRNASPWSIKVYVKGDELHLNEIPRNADDWDNSRDGRQWGGKLPENLYKRAELCAWADNKVRVELTLRGKELKKLGYRFATMLSPAVVSALFHSYIGRMEIADNAALTVSDTEVLSRALQSTYTLWLAGHDLRQFLPKSTFTRQKRQIYNAVGVDISVPPQTNSGKVIPLRGIMKNFTPAPPPDFASNDEKTIKSAEHYRDLISKLKTLEHEAEAEAMPDRARYSACIPF